MAEGMEERFERRIDALDAVFAFMEEFFASRGISESNAFHASFIVEELFTNAVKYSPGGKEIALELERKDDELTIRLTDFGVEPFDPTGAPDVDTTLPLEARKIGGLGLHLIKRMARDVSYDYKDKNSTITIKMGLED